MEVGTSVRSAALAWLAEMEACVRAVDYARCRAIFADEVVGFGTYAALVAGLDNLEREQWRRIWGTIREFTFLVDELHVGGGGDLVWLACPWTSIGVDAAGDAFPRPGRITAVIERRGDGWRAVHTHHSLAPRPAQSGERDQGHQNESEAEGTVAPRLTRQ